MTGETLPKAREGLLTSDHSKRGRRFVIVLDPSSMQVSLLEPWEHAILVLSDGTRSAESIAELLEGGIDGETVDLKMIRRTIKFFEREKLIEPIARSKPPIEAPGPRTVAELQLAYREWHKDPLRTGQILSGAFAPPFDMPASPPPLSGLDPTVALPGDASGRAQAQPIAAGSTLVLAEAESLLHKPTPDLGSRAGKAAPPLDASRSGPDRAPKVALEARTVIGSLSGGAVPASSGAATVAPEEFEREMEDSDVAALLEAVDRDFLEAETREAEAQKIGGKKKKHVPPPVGKATGGVAVPPDPREAKRAAAKVVMSASESAMSPTIVADSADDALENKPVLLGPKEAPERGPRHDEATARLEPRRADKRQSIEVGAIVEDVSQIEGPTEGDFSPHSLTGQPAIHHPPPLRPAVKIEAKIESEPSMDAGPNLPQRARDVFERLRKAGLKARAQVDDRTELRAHRFRRRDPEVARAFDEALLSLSAGDLDVALKHFKRLLSKMPGSKRLAAFIEAIEVERTGATTGKRGKRAADSERTQGHRMLESFEGVLEEAVAYGRCPACFSMVESNFTECFACGFALKTSARG
jgi:hypothetical protein